MISKFILRVTGVFFVFILVACGGDNGSVIVQPDPDGETPTPTPAVTPEPSPTVTVLPTPIPEPTPDPTPEPMPIPEPTPEPTQTPAPTSEPTPTPTSTPIPTVTPTPTPVPGDPEISIGFPTNGAELGRGTLVVEGQGANLESVMFSINDGEEFPANGTETWDVVIEAGSLGVGSHTLKVRGVGQVEDVSESVSIDVVASDADGTQKIFYTSSVDGEELGAHVFLPSDFDPVTDGSVPLVVYLHGAGGTGIFVPGLQPLVQQLESRRWVGINPDGREWGLANQGCNWRTSAAYVDSPDPAVGPGEQDIFDAITWARQRYSIDMDRIYLIGFSMGGRGAYAIGLKNPDFFAAIGPMGPASDMFEVFNRRPEPAACKEGITGGKPGDSAFVDTMYSITSGRFLLENAYNLPVYHAHGLNDSITLNQFDQDSYLHGAHMTINDNWDECHGSTDLCFGHTPTLEELNTAIPDGYDWAFMFTPVGHEFDAKWFDGTNVNNSDMGTIETGNPNRYVGMMDFFDRYTRQDSPDVVVYKTYTDTHEQAYWLTLSSANAWQNIPAAVRAEKNLLANVLELELSRAGTITIDMAHAGLSADRMLSMNVAPLFEPVFDPALVMSDSEVLSPRFVLAGDFLEFNTVIVRRNGAPLSDSLIELTETSLTIGPLEIDDAAELTVEFSVSGEE